MPYTCVEVMRQFSGVNSLGRCVFKPDTEYFLTLNKYFLIVRNLENGENYSYHLLAIPRHFSHC